MKNKFATVALLLMLSFAEVVHSDDNSSGNSEAGEAGSSLYMNLSILGGATFFMGAICRAVGKAKLLAIENELGTAQMVAGIIVFFVFSTITGSIIGYLVAIPIDNLNQYLQADWHNPE